MTTAASLPQVPSCLVITLKRAMYGLYGKVNRPVPAPPLLWRGARAEGVCASPCCPAALLQVTRPVSFGEVLELREFVHGAGGEAGGREGSPPGAYTYRLCGVVVHLDMMGSCFYGHYIAYVRRGEEWFWCAALAAPGEGWGGERGGEQWFWSAAWPPLDRRVTVTAPPPPRHRAAAWTTTRPRRCRGPK